MAIRVLLLAFVSLAIAAVGGNSHSATLDEQALLCGLNLSQQGDEVRRAFERIQNQVKTDGENSRIISAEVVARADGGKVLRVKIASKGSTPRSKTITRLKEVQILPSTYANRRAIRIATLEGFRIKGTEISRPLYDTIVRENENIPIRGRLAVVVPRKFGYQESLELLGRISGIAIPNSYFGTSSLYDKEFNKDRLLEVDVSGRSIDFLDAIEHVQALGFKVKEAR